MAREEILDWGRDQATMLPEGNMKTSPYPTLVSGSFNSVEGRRKCKTWSTRPVAEGSIA